MKYDLMRHNIKSDVPKLDDVVLKLPKLRGQNIEEHFLAIAEDQSRPYMNLVVSLLDQLPVRPKVWSTEPGWTCYDLETGPRPVPFPDEDALVFDIEVCMSAGSAPTLACAAGRKFWYSWTSRSLMTNTTGHYLDDHKVRLPVSVLFF
jgi:DNA polymerase gamma 1